MEKVCNTQLPEMFRPLLWSVDFSQVDQERDKKTIIVNAINYGTMAHWRWLVEKYGFSEVNQTLTTIPNTELKPRARRLAELIFSINYFNYAPRGTN